MRCRTGLLCVVHRTGSRDLTQIVRKPILQIGSERAWPPKILRRLKHFMVTETEARSTDRDYLPPLKPGSKRDSGSLLGR